MKSYGKRFQITPESFIPFNDAPEYLSGTISLEDEDKIIIAGTAQYQVKDWYNIGVRTHFLEAHSFAFSVKAIPKISLGAYSIGIIGNKRIDHFSIPSINISHFLCSSVSLYRELLGNNFYSGFGRDNEGRRTQIGEKADAESENAPNILTVKYDAQNELLSCLVDTFPIHYIKARLEKFQLEIRFEAVGIAGNFEVKFENLYYYSFDGYQPANIQELTGKRLSQDHGFKPYISQNKPLPRQPKRVQVPASQETQDSANLKETKTLPNNISILFLAADPTDAARLRQGKEFREIQEKVQLSKNRKQFELYQQMSARPADISQAMLDVQPQIVHFSGHGTASGTLSFENILGKTQPVTPKALAELFAQFAEHVNCVILNACHSEMQANAIVQHVDCVIGMNQAISDKAAIAFSIGFYQALGAGRSIEDAYKLGCIQISLQGFSENLTPVLMKKGQI